jgi:translation initiation factor 5A
MGKKSKKKVQEVMYGQFAPDMIVKVKDQELTVVNLIVQKAKRGNLKKVKVTFKDANGKEIVDTKPENRRVVLIKGGNGKTFVQQQKEEVDTNKDKEVDIEVHTGQSGASLTVPIRAGEVRKGGYVMLKGMPCKVVEVSISKTGKHGHAKAYITGLDVFTGRKYVEISPTSHNMTAPAMYRSEWQMTDLSRDGQMTLMDMGGNIKDDLDLVKTTTGEYNKVSQQIFDKFPQLEEGRGLFVTVLKAITTEQVVDYIIKDA